MKGLRIGRRRGRDNDVALSPLELALRPAIVEGRWQVPDHFNFTRDVLEALARDPKRRALTSLGKEGVIEHKNFYEIADGAAIWATRLRESGITPGDRVLVVSGTTVDWLEIVLGALKVGAVVAPSLADVSSSMLERLVSSTDAALVVAERSLEPTIERMGFTPDVYLYDEGEPRSSKDVPVAATHDTASRDLAFIVSTTGVGGTRKDVAHTHGSVFATRVQAEHWLVVGRGDAVWCTTDAASPLTMWNTVFGPWSRGAEVVVHEGAFDADERLDLLFRLGPSILCQSPAEYRALAEHRRLERALGDDERGVRRRHETLELRRRRRRQTRNDHRADLPDAEQCFEPVDGAVGHEDHAVAGADAAFAERQCPHGRALRDLQEGTRLDDAVRAQEHQRASLGIARERLDHVTGEVEPVRNLPATVTERRAERELERRRRSAVVASTAPSYAQPFHGFSIIDPFRI